MKELQMNDLIKQMYLSRNSLASLEGQDDAFIVHKVTRDACGEVVVKLIRRGEAFPSVTASIADVTPSNIDDAVRKQFASDCDPYNYFFNVIEWLHELNPLGYPVASRNKITFCHEDEFVCEVLWQWMHQFSKMTYMTASFDVWHARELFHRWGRTLPNGEKQFSKKDIRRLVQQNKTRLLVKNS